MIIRSDCLFVRVLQSLPRCMAARLPIGVYNVRVGNDYASFVRVVFGWGV
jgi:hypothetical protein